MIDKTNLRIETVNEYCIVDEKNQIIKDRFCSEEEAAKWLEDAYGIKHEPKPQPKIGGWIPCSERLPEENEEVICCFKSGVVKALVLFNCKFHGKVYAYEKSDIIAWQPLPEAYHE